MGGVGVTLLVVVTMLVVSKRKRRQKYASPALQKYSTRQSYLEHEAEDQMPENSSTSAATAMPREYIGARCDAGHRYDGSLEVRPARFQSSSAAASTTSSHDTSNSTSNTARDTVRVNMRSLLALVERANFAPRYNMNAVEEDSPPPYDDATGSADGLSGSS